MLWSRVSGREHKDLDGDVGVDVVVAHEGYDVAPLAGTLASENKSIETRRTIKLETRRTIKRWQNRDMCLRWPAAGMLEAEQQFRKIIGYSDLAKLAVAVERDLATNRPSTNTPPAAEQAATLVSV